MEVVSSKQTFVSSDYLKNVREALESLEQFVCEHNDDYLDFEAWTVFHVWLESRPKKTAPYYSLFRAWQFFHWKPTPGTVSLPLDENCRTIAEAYLKLNAENLEVSHNEILRRAVASSPDIYELGMFNGDYVSAYAVIAQKRVLIYQPNLAKTARMGDFLVAHSVPFENEILVLIGDSGVFSRTAQPLVQRFSLLVKRIGADQNTFEDLESDFFNLLYDLLKLRKQV